MLTSLKFPSGHEPGALQHVSNRASCTQNLLNLIIPSHNPFSSGDQGNDRDARFDGVGAVSGHALIQNGMKCVSQFKADFQIPVDEPTLGSSALYSLRVFNPLGWAWNLSGPSVEPLG